MSRAFLLLLIISSNILIGQSLKVSYKVTAESIFDTNRPDTLPDMVKKTFKDAERNFVNISYTLRINNNESSFEMEDLLLKDAGGNGRLTKALAGFTGKIYCNKTKDIKLKQSDVYGQTFLISSSFNTIKWKITKESKDVRGFKTFKAKATEEYETGKGKDEWNLVAWFSPEINTPFGPGGYGNLPGLILELERGGKTYSASKIETDKTIQIERPKEGKLISQTDFDKIGRNISKEISDN